MTLLAILTFSGEMPRMAKDKLPVNAAQAALNCEFSSGDVTAVLGLGDLSKRAAGLTNPTGAFFLDDANFFTWTGTFTAVKGTVIDDFHRRVYYTDGSAYLRVIQQHYAVQAVAGWDASTTYALNDEVTYPMVLPANYSAGATYTKGDIRQYPSNSRLLYRCLRSGIIAITPGSDATAWELWGEGIRYRSLQAANLAKTPSDEPTWWIQNGVSLVGAATRAGVPAPTDWTAKVYGAGTYQVNVVSLDPLGLLSVYNVPTLVADARAALDGSTTGLLNTSALIAVARKRLQANLVIRAKDGAAANTGMAYYASENVKQDEAVVDLYPIIAGRMYSFDAPTKPNSIAEYTVTQLWTDSGNVVYADTTAYFDGTDKAVIRVIGETTIEVQSATDAGEWASDVGLTLPATLTDVRGVTLTNGVIVAVPEMMRVTDNVARGQVGLRLRGYDGVDNSIQFEVDSQNSDLNASNENLTYRGLRLVLKDMRLGPWKGAANDYDNSHAYVIGEYAWYLNVGYICILGGTGNVPTNTTYFLPYLFSAGDRISYVRGFATLGFVSLVDSNGEVPIPAEWSSGTTYALNGKTFYLNTAYKSLQATNLNHNPASATDWWVPYYSENWTIRQFIGELSYGTSRQSYVFTYTLVNDWNEEGPPADPVSIDADYGDQITLHGYINSAANAYQDYRKGTAGYRIRYYGFVADSTGAGQFKLIRESDPLGTSSFAGAFGHLIINRPADWQDALTTTLFDLPPATPLAIAGGENGMLHILTADYLATCEPFKGWAWPEDYRKALPARGIGMLSAPAGVLITTNKKPRYAAGPIPEQLTLQELLIEQAGISQKSMCSMGERGIAYASNDGIVIVQGLGASLASGTLFTRKEWRSRYATLLSKMRLVYHDERLVCIFPGTDQSEASNYQGFMIRFEDGAPMYTRLAVNGSGVAVDTATDQMLIANLTGFYAFEAGYALPLTWQSKEFITARPENMGAAMAEYTGGPFTVDVHVDGANVYTKTLPYAASRVSIRWKLPSGYKSQNFSMYAQNGTPLAWSSLTTYAAGDTVTQSSAQWVSLQAANLNHTPVAGSVWWSRIAGGSIHKLLLGSTMMELTKA